MSSGSRKKRQSVSQTVGGVLFGFEQQVWRNAPPPNEVVHKARPDAPSPGADGELITLEIPEALEIEDPWAGIEDELADEDDPWADYAAVADEDETTALPAEPAGDAPDGPPEP